jgi:hypothetical protein
MLPMEKGLHNRRMELLQRKLLQNEERLRREACDRVEAEHEQFDSEESTQKKRAHV